MGMFLNYHNIADNYKPNNLMCSFPVGKSYTKLDPIEASKPYEEYDAKGNLIGYYWRQGETINLEFNIDGEVTIADTKLIYVVTGQYPTEQTVGKINEKAYNLADMRSWTCTSITDDTYTWTEDAEFDTQGNKSVYINAADYLKDKHVSITLYNFRMETIHKVTIDAKTQVILTIDTELSKRMNKGIYYCSLNVFNDETNIVVFDSHDCVLLVK